MRGALENVNLKKNVHLGDQKSDGRPVMVASVRAVKSNIITKTVMYTCQYDTVPETLHCTWLEIAKCEATKICFGDYTSR
jgi:hypothetical protein